MNDERRIGCGGGGRGSISATAPRNCFHSIGFALGMAMDEGRTSTALRLSLDMLQDSRSKTALTSTLLDFLTDLLHELDLENCFTGSTFEEHCAQIANDFAGFIGELTADIDEDLKFGVKRRIDVLLAEQGSSADRLPNAQLCVTRRCRKLRHSSLTGEL
nr:hypothetical protein Iba_scaffold2820CG0060 [Ipomoea batatas]